MIKTRELTEYYFAVHCNYKELIKLQKEVQNRLEIAKSKKHFNLSTAHRGGNVESNFKKKVASNKKISNIFYYKKQLSEGKFVCIELNGFIPKLSVRDYIFN